MPNRQPKAGSSAGTALMEVPHGEKERVFDVFRRWGYLEADLDPLGFLQPVPHPELEIDSEFAQEARRIYCGTVGAEFMHIPDPACRRWIQERLEGAPATVDQSRVLDLLIRGEFFELVLQQRYLGTKRFSLEGVTALLPLVDEVLEGAGHHGAVELVMGMSHRGRLNVIAHVVTLARGSIRGIRGRGSTQCPRRWGCEISHGRHRRICDPQRGKDPHPSRLQSQSLGGG